ncbi:zinc finger protein 567-like [Episyrphus balteatus]|uniref:zinc finger protein 567-like n=1 Tax=Episyrphus balteatus TaxID=286459 RepID=UPI0024862F60|nr:zinc finger protein 567-like [Episyrphus balteatus]
MAKEISITCRTCLEKNEQLLSMYDDDDNKIVEMLEYILDTQLDVSDELPQKVCHGCFDDISRCYSFKTKCNNSFQILRNMLDKRKTIPEFVLHIKVEPEVHISEQFDQELNQTQMTADESFGQITTVHSVFDMGQISIKREPIETVAGSYSELGQCEKEVVTSDSHTVQYLITELKDEPDSNDEVLEEEVNILHHCAYCGARFSQELDFNNHLKSCKQSKPIKLLERPLLNAKNKHLCPYCDKAFPRPCRLKNHLRKHPEEVKADKMKQPLQIKPPPIKKFMCPHCDLSFILETSLKYHMSFHKGEKNFNELSNKTLNLDTHLGNHTKQNKLKCKDCGLVFEKATQLKSHTLDHKRNQTFLCKSCPKKFIHAEHFKIHSILAHNDERPFKCKFCGNGFSNKYKVIYHQRKHVANFE